MAFNCVPKEAVSLKTCEALSLANAEALALLTRANVAKDKGWSDVLSSTNAQEIILVAKEEYTAPWDCRSVIAIFFYATGFLSNWSCI